MQPLDPTGLSGEGCRKPREEPQFGGTKHGRDREVWSRAREKLSQGAGLGPLDGLGVVSEGTRCPEVTGLILKCLASSSSRPRALLGSGMMGGTTVGGHSQGSWGLLPPREPETISTVIIIFQQLLLLMVSSGSRPEEEGPFRGLGRPGDPAVI